MSMIIFAQFPSFQQHALNDQQQLTVYRILQEQCNNIIKYAKAQSVNIVFYTGEGLFKMNISDDGQGMVPGKQSKGIGLRNINSRLSLLGGSAIINSTQGKGFALEITIPVIAGDKERRTGMKKRRN